MSKTAFQAWKNSLISLRLVLQDFKKKEAKRKIESVFPEGLGKKKILSFGLCVFYALSEPLEKKEKEKESCLFVDFVCFNLMKSTVADLGYLLFHQLHAIARHG